MENVKLSFTEDALRAIAKKAIKRKTGARGLRAIMEEHLLNLMYDIPELETVSEVVINGDTVAKNGDPLVVHQAAPKPAAGEASKN